jgi:hypothetical protein
MEEGLRTVLELWINVPPSALRLVTTATVNDLLCPALTMGWLLLLVQIVLLCACLVRRVRHLAPLDVRMLYSLSHPLRISHWITDLSNRRE